MKSFLSTTETNNLLLFRRLPARLNANQVAVVLGFSPYDIPVLTNRKMLSALGRPAQNSTKYFAAIEIERLSSDPTWLGKATRILNDYWKTKNIKRQKDQDLDVS